MKALQVATREALEDYGHDVLFEVKFDWLKNNWISEVSGYDKWLQCFEKKVLYMGEVSTSTLLSITDLVANFTAGEYAGKYLYITEGNGSGQIRKIEDNSINQIVIEVPFDNPPTEKSNYEIVDLLGLNDVNGLCRVGSEYDNTYHVVFDERNKGTGTVDAVSFSYSGEFDTWVLICIDEDAGQFLVWGEYNEIRDDAYIGQAYNNGFISFTLNNDIENPFKQGDIIYIYPAVSVENGVTYITNSISSSEGFVIEGGPDFLTWKKVEWYGENIEVYLRTSSDVPGRTYSAWKKVDNGQDLEELLSPRRYIQFMIKFDGSDYNVAKLSRLRFYYDVKSHTNTTISEGYYEGFNRIKDIRIDRSAVPFQQEGYAIADGNITVVNEDSYFSVYNEESPYYGYIDSDIRVKIRLGIDKEFFDKFLGVIDGFNLESSGATVSIRFKDLGKLFTKKTIEDGDVSFRTWRDIKFSTLCQIIAFDCGLDIDNFSIFNSLAADTVFEYVNLRGVNAWSALQQMAQATLSNVYFDESGSIIIKDMFFSKNLLSSPNPDFENGDFVKFLYNDMYSSFLYLCYYKQDTSMLYYYSTKFEPLIQNIISAAILHFDENDLSEHISTFWAADNHNLYRILADLETPRFEKEFTISEYSFTNIMFGSNISSTEVDTDAEEYAEKLFMLLKSESVANSYTLYCLSKDLSAQKEFILGNLGRTVFEGIYYSYNLPHAARSSSAVSVYVVYPDETETLIPFDENLPYIESPSSWRFKDANRDAIVINKEIPSTTYKVKYFPVIPFDQPTNVNIVTDSRFFPELYQYTDSSLFLANFVGIMDCSDTLTHHGHIFYISSTGDSSDPLTIKTTSGYGATLPTDISKIISCAFDGYKKIFAVLYKAVDDSFKIYWVSLDNVSNNGEEIITVDNLIESDLKIYNMVFNKDDKLFYISGGYGTADGRKVAKLFSYSPGTIICTFDNLAGKPLAKVYPDDPYNMDSVEEKDYYFYFQKRGGFRALTSQIWSWSRYIREDVDKDKCIIKQDTVDSVTTANGDNREFFVPLTEITMDEIQYVYVDGSDIGSVNWVKSQDSVILAYAPERGSVVTFGAGKQLYKYFGLFASFDITSSLDSSGWAPATGGWGTFQIYKPVRLRITFKNATPSSGEVLTLNGINEANADVIENITIISGTQYRSSIDNVDRDINTDENGLKYIETVSLYRSVSNIDASQLWDGTASQLQVESVIMPLISGVTVEIYTSADVTEDQFGGDGTVSGYTDKVFISIKKEEGLSEINSFSNDLSFQDLTVTGDGIVAGLTYPLGKIFFYSPQRTKIPAIPDYKIEYDTNMTQFSLQIADSTVKNKIIVQATRKETDDFRDFDLDNGNYIGGGTLPPGYTEDGWLWAKLHTAWRTQSPYYLGKGRFIEFNISFSEPLDNGGQLTNIRFDSRFYTVLGRLDSSGNWKNNDVESYFPGLLRWNSEPTKAVLMAGKGTGWPIGTYNNENVYRVFNPWDSTAYNIPAVYPSRFTGTDFPDANNPPDLSGGIVIDTNNPYIRIRIDDTYDREINVIARSADPDTALYAQEIVDAINAAFADYGTIASVKTDYFGSGERVYIELKSLADPYQTSPPSRIEFLLPAGNGIGSEWAATVAIFGNNYPVLASPRNAIQTTIGEMEIWNCEIYIEDIQRKLDYLAGEYTIYQEGTGNDAVYVIEISQAIREQYADKLIAIYYPRRLYVTQLDIDQSYGRGVSGNEGQGSIRRFYYDEENKQPRLLSSYDLVGTKYTLTDPVGGFHLNMLWPNSAVLEGTSYLRVENPTNNELDANYNPEADPSRLDVWIDKIEVRGLRIFDAPLEITTIEDVKSRKRFLRQEMSITNNFIQDPDVAYIIGSQILKKYAYPLHIGNSTILGIPAIELLDVLWVRDKNAAASGILFEIVNISESLSVDAPYTITLTIEKLPEEYQPKSTNKFLYYSVIKFGKEGI